MTRLLFALLTAAVLLAASVRPALPQDASAPPAAQSRPAAAPVNINTATAAQLESLPGIGARTAERIVEYREKNGSFKKVEDLMNVRGIGEKSFLKLKPLITVNPARNERASAQ